MTIEFIGMIQPRRQSEIHPPSGASIDLGYLRASAEAHDFAVKTIFPRISKVVQSRDVVFG